MRSAFAMAASVHTRTCCGFWTSRRTRSPSTKPPSCRGDRRNIPGAVRASAGLSTTAADVDRFLAAVARVAGGEPLPVPYDQDEHTGDYWPHTADGAWASAGRRLGAACARG